MSKKYYPKIQFSINLTREKKIFLQRKRNLQWFLPAGMSFVMRKEFIKEKDKILNAYLNTYYLDQKEYLAVSVKNTQTKWRKVEKVFFNKVDKIFNNWPWPKGNYRGYVSIARSFPRYIEEKVFAFPAKSYKPGRENIDLRVTSHEMLHFIEYDYLQKKFGLRASESNSSDNTFWQFTENLNVLIENMNYWREFNIGYKSKPYRDCQKLYDKMKKIWDKNKDIDNLIKKTFKLN